MEDENWDKFIKKSEEDYNKIRAIPCKAFGGELIYFNNHGWNHLMKKGRQMRNLRDQFRRIQLVQKAPGILSKSTSYATHDIFGTVQLWGINHKTKKKIITVVIRQISGEPKHFLSIMNKRRPKNTKGLF